MPGIQSIVVKYFCIVAESNETYCGDRFEMYISNPYVAYQEQAMCCYSNILQKQTSTLVKKKTGFVVIRGGSVGMYEECDSWTIKKTED